ncbi:hypothetical protein CXK91_03925 [Stutzerimonas stutzeri]|uniref:Uncharacterized protein n=1 Tax=Stutzerimonas stutzeri TaxID=316 RepID=A0A2S4AR48_STUST|nr:hypothetical protein CXK91_03925 [Stutzerimonas stutzeri]
MVVLVRACGGGFDREERRHGFWYVSAALSSAFGSGFALLGDSLFFARAKKSKQKKARPYIRPCATRRVRSLHRRSRGRLTRAIHGPLSLSPHPCGSPPCTTIPLSLLKGNLVLPVRPRMETHKAKSTAKQSEVSLRSIRRPGLESSTGSRTQALRRGTRGVDAERGMTEQRPVMTCPQSSDVGWKTAQHFPPQASSKFLPGHSGLLCKQVGKLRVTRPSPIAQPFRQHQTPLSGGRAQVAWKGLSGMDAARAAMGQGWPFAADPWNVTGAREPRRSRGRMQGQDFLVPLGGAGHPATAKRNSPSRAKPARQNSTISDCHIQPRPQALHPTQPPAAQTKPAVCRCARKQRA